MKYSTTFKKLVIIEYLLAIAESNTEQKIIEELKNILEGINIKKDLKRYINDTEIKIINTKKDIEKLEKVTNNIDSNLNDYSKTYAYEFLNKKNTLSDMVCEVKSDNAKN